MQSNVKVDSTDIKLLQILQRNSRTNINQIGKDCGLSSSAVLYRVRKLEKSKVIVAANLDINRGAIGYPYQATVGIVAESPKIDLVAEEVRSQPNIIVCTKSVGKYNMLCLVISKTMSEFEKATQKIKNVDGVRSISINLHTEHHNKFTGSIVRPMMDDESTLDELDRRIIQQLMSDSRMPFTKIAEKLKVSHETVRTKFEKMKHDGIIESCSITIDWSKLGYQGTAFIFINQESGNEKSDIVGQLKKNPSIFMVITVIGAYDAIAFAQLRDLRNFAKVVDYIQQIPSVRNLDVSFATFTYFSFAPIPKAPIQCDTLELS